MPLTFKRSEPGFWISGGVHAALVVAALVAFSSEKLPDAEEGIPVEVLTENQFSQITKGETSAKEVKPDPKPRVDRVADTRQERDPGEAKQDAPAPPKRPVEAKIADEEAEAATAPPTPSPPERPVETAAATPPPPPPPPARPEPAKPEPAKPEPAKPEPAKPEPAKAAKAEPPKEDLKLAERDDADAIAKAEAKKAAEAKAQADARKAEADKAKAAAAAKAQAEKAKAVADAKAKAELDAKLKAMAEADAKAKAESEAKEKALAEAKEKAEAEHRKKVADAKAKAVAQAKAEAETKARRQAELAEKFNAGDIRQLLASKAPSQSTGATGREVQRTASLGTATGSAPRLNPSQRDQIAGLIREQLIRCWQPPIAVQSAQKPPTATIRLSIRQDGSLAGNPTLVNSSSDPLFRPVAESAMRATHRCAPLHIPSQFVPYYQDWKDLVVDFDPREMG